MKIENGRDWLKHNRIELLHDGPRITVDLKRVSRQAQDFLEKEYHFVSARNEIYQVLVELIQDGFIEVSGYVVKCCEKVAHSPEDKLNHANGFKLTDKGRDSLHGHIIP